MNPNIHRSDPQFPAAPEGWSSDQAVRVASDEGLALQPDHWRAIAALQAYFHQHEDDTHIHARELHDALDEEFHQAGGIRYLYALFPGGPVAQGCRLAGLKAPPGAEQPNFGSVS